MNDMFLKHLPAQTCHEEGDVRAAHSGSRHVHDAIVWLAVHWVLWFCPTDTDMDDVVGVAILPPKCSELYFCLGS